MNEKELFAEVFEHFKEKYNGLDRKGPYIYYKGGCRFNTDGFNLLYNLKRLCNVLEEELL